VADLKRLAGQFADQLWRLNNLYYITDKQGKRVLFRLNDKQLQLYHEMWYLSLILKARQFGYTTFIDLFILDTCLFNEDTKAGIIAHKLDDAKVIFRNKIQYPYAGLPDGLKAVVPIKTERAEEYVFGNNSSIRVSTSYRSGTLQILHISELGKICAKEPEKAKEINTGAIEAVAKGQMIFIESTAEGREGLFHDLSKTAQDLSLSGRAPNEMEFKFFFTAWFENPEYTLNPVNVPIPQDMHVYFKALEDEHGIYLTPGQKAWYVVKAARLKEDMFREYPSTPEEAFKASVEGAYYGKIIARLRTQNRIRRVAYEPLLPVHTFWDLGLNDAMAIWFYQHRIGERRLIDYYENSGEGIKHYARIMKDKKYVYGTHYMPHDAKVQSIQTGKTLIQYASNLGIKPIVRVRRAKNQEELLNDIATTRGFLETCWIDEEKCDKGIKALENYRKEWDENLGTFKRTPLHNWASNGADSLRCGAVGIGVINTASSDDLIPEEVPDY